MLCVGAEKDLRVIEPATFLWNQPMVPRIDANGTVVVRERYNTQQYGRRPGGVYTGVCLSIPGVL